MTGKKNLDELQKIRDIVRVVISLLEASVNAELRVEQKELLNFLVGGKENVVSIITKLCNILIKLDGIRDNCGEEEMEKMEDIDFELIEKFLRENRRHTTSV
jgi:hypothetical protein